MKIKVISLWVLLIFGISVYSQEKIRLNGRVYDHLGIPVPGASVWLSNQKTGTITDSSGYYHLNKVSKGSIFLKVNFLGFKPYFDTVFIDKSMDLDIRLIPDEYSLSEVVVHENSKSTKNREEALNIELVRNDFILQNNSGNLVKTLEKLPGVYSMDIGSGFSKPVIRGMGFNRVVVSENGIKQENQQWGADHGLEIDQFNVGRIEIFKGPMSLRYGSDAIGGVLEIMPVVLPDKNQVYIDLNSVYKSNNNLFGLSALLGIKHNKLHFKTRFTGQHFGDYHIPADSILYLTRYLPIYNNSLKNTAGYERDLAFDFGYQSHELSSIFTITNVFQKAGFFPGSHGIPDLERLIDDGNSRNIDYPNSTVNHLKIINNTTISVGKWMLMSDMAFQHNHRQEWAKFHTHYNNQLPPLISPDLELDFNLNTLSCNIEIESEKGRTFKHNVGINTEFQKNTISGYSFLLPEYSRFMLGGFVIEQFKLNEKFKITGGIRFDFGKIIIDAYKDTILEDYLQSLNLYSPDKIEFYSLRSNSLNRSFNDFTGSIGFVYNPDKWQTFKTNFGKSFRLPGVNEMASNGVHHGTFRHELGDALLNSEKGFQLDASYIFDNHTFYFSINPFINWFSNYIYLEPSGEWSVLPHAGQIYSYKQAKAVTGGGECSISYKFLKVFTVESGIEYVYMQNLTDGYPLPFSPPASIINSLVWEFHENRKLSDTYFKVEHRYTTKQNRIARNEELTPAYNLFDLSLSSSFQIKKTKVVALVQLQNILNTKYYNHLSYYRKLNIPEAGRNLQLTFRFISN